MNPLPLDIEVRNHLVDELGEHGLRALELFDTAHALMSADLPSAPRLGQTVAHCLRQAFRAISTAGGADDPGRWRGPSRAVVEACEQYRRVEGLAPASEQALRGLLSRIDHLQRFHDNEPSSHQRQLRNIMDRIGAVPITPDPIKASQDLLDLLNTTAHRNTGEIDAEQLWGESVEMLRKLFLPPQVRIPELERLAEIEAPTEADRDAVIKLVASPEHLRRFLDSVTSPIWLKLLGDSGHLDPPNTRTRWPAHQAVRRLAEDHPREVSVWLQDMARQHKSDPTRARYIARAASSAGEPGAAVVLEILQEHQQDHDILFSGLHAAEQLPASDQRVEAFADVILNESSWSRTTWPIPLLRHIEDGVTQQNARQRIELLCYKIRTGTDNDSSLWMLGADLSGSVSDIDGERTGERFEALLCCLLATVAKSWTYLPVSDLLELAQLLPDRLAPRVRAWTLAQAPQAAPELLLEEICHAMSSREPSGDDLAMLDRALNDLDAAICSQRWSSVLGDAPSITDLGAALRSPPLPEHLMCRLLWASLLPEEVQGRWAAAVQIFSSRFGSPRQYLQRRHGVEVSDVVSPIDEAELLSVEPEAAARLVAGWRPARGEWPSQKHLVTQTLQSVVEQNPDKWLTAPLAIASTLHHPLYISSYLRAAAALAPKHALPIRSLLNVVELIKSKPWPITPITEGDLDDTDDWAYAEAAAIRLIQTLARSKDTFAGCAEEVWDLLEAEITNCPPRPEPVPSSRWDAYTSAINRTCTQALDAALWLLRNAYLDSGEVAPTALRVLDTSLRLEGDDGAEHRAVIAPWIAFLRHALGDWTEANRCLMFGPEAPEGLAQSMIDDAIHRGQPNDWLMENHREMVHNAVERGVNNALDHLLVAMLWELPGYSVQDVIGLVGRTPEMMSAAGDRLGRLLSRSNTEQGQTEIAVSFWQAALDRAPELGETAGDALQGFGWFSEAQQIYSSVWEHETLRTIQAAGGRIDWQHGVAQRVAKSDPSQTGLAILDELVRGPGNEWERRDVAEQAAQMLDSARGLQDTVEYRRLRATLMERGLLN